MQDDFYKKYKHYLSDCRQGYDLDNKTVVPVIVYDEAAKKSIEIPNEEFKIEKKEIDVAPESETKKKSNKFLKPALVAVATLVIIVSTVAINNNITENKQLEELEKSRNAYREGIYSYILDNTARFDLSPKEIGEELLFYKGDNQAVAIRYIYDSMSNNTSQKNIDEIIKYATNSRVDTFSEYVEVVLGVDEGSYIRYTDALTDAAISKEYATNIQEMVSREKN